MYDIEKENARNKKNKSHMAIIVAIMLLAYFTVITMVNLPLFKECKSKGFSNNYCFWQLK